MITVKDEEKFYLAFRCLHYAENGGDIADALILMRESIKAPWLDPNIKVLSVPRMEDPEDPSDLYEWENWEDYEIDE